MLFSSGSRLSGERLSQTQDQGQSEGPFPPSGLAGTVRLPLTVSGHVRVLGPP